ncbi:MAG: sugar phosphate isomerase/epimerase [Lentisphaeria bacterium]|nr:sugar phosphate isomerase/epimerase [Lentisphaeria bacterium]
MKKIPLTYFFDFSTADDDKRRSVLHEFSLAGAENIVLSPYFIYAVRNDCRMRDVFLQELEREGLKFLDAHSPFGKNIDLNCPDEEYRKKSVELHSDALSIASDMGVKTITVHVGTDCIFPGISGAEHLENIRRMLEKLLPCAEKNKIAICIENIWSPCNSPESLLYLKNCFDSDYLGFCYDAGHANLMDKGRNFAECNAADCWRFAGVEPQWENAALEKMLPHVMTCHLHDNDGFSDTHSGIGTGTVDFNHIIPLLYSAPKLQCMHSEVKSDAGNIPIKKLCADFKAVTAV